MTSYTITVNGKSYDVTVQKKKELSATSGSIPKAVGSQTIVVPTVSSAVGIAFKSDATTGGEGEKVVAPMPGKIIEIKVRVGDSVERGQELLIMEAMKMHNPILAVSGGIISKLYVKVNDPVQSGQSLLAIK